ncbi:leucine-rich repeat-containing G-protein coupled receptor 4-like, partial [Scleropages formosus]
TLTGTKIHAIPPGLCEDLRSLRTLDLSYNQIQELPGFQNCFRLEELNLQHNCIRQIQAKTFEDLATLRIFDLSLNLLSTVPTAGLRSVRHLKLAGNLEMKGALATKDLPKLRSEGKSAFKPCDQLLGSWMIRLTVWFIGLSALVFNTVVLVGTFFPRSALSPAKLLVGLLAGSNLLMGIYVFLLAVLDAATWGNFADFGVLWETGLGCRAAGFLATFSSEWSILLLALAAMERSFSVHCWVRKGEGRHRWGNWIYLAAALLPLLAGGAACFPLFHVGEFSSSPLCLLFPALGHPSLGFTVTLVLLNLLAYLFMAVVYTHLYCSLGKLDLTDLQNISMLRHVAWLIFVNCVCFCPLAAFSFSPLLPGFARKPEIMKSVTLIFFPLSASLNPVLYIFFNTNSKDDWLQLQCCNQSKSQAVVAGRVTTRFSRDGNTALVLKCDCRTYSQLHGSLALGQCCESILVPKALACRHLARSLSCPTLATVPCGQAQGYWSDCRTVSTHFGYADKGDSFVSDSSDWIQACFCQSRGVPLVCYANNIPRNKD